MDSLILHLITLSHTIRLRLLPILGYVVIFCWYSQDAAGSTWWPWLGRATWDQSPANFQWLSFGAWFVWTTAQGEVGPAGALQWWTSGDKSHSAHTVGKCSSRWKMMKTVYRNIHARLSYLLAWYTRKCPCISTFRKDDWLSTKHEVETTFILWRCYNSDDHHRAFPVMATLVLQFSIGDCSRFLWSKCSEEATRQLL